MLKKEKRNFLFAMDQYTGSFNKENLEIILQKRCIHILLQQLYIEKNHPLFWQSIKEKSMPYLLL